jgi:hypothetical protein
MKYKIRAKEAYSAVETTIPIEIDTEEFRTSKIPYEGNSEQEFIDYINENNIQDEDVFSEMGLSEKTRDLLYGVFIEREWKPFYHSSEQGSDEWIEIVALDENNRRSYDWYEVLARS